MNSSSALSRTRLASYVVVFLVAALLGQSSHAASAEPDAPELPIPTVSEQNEEPDAAEVTRQQLVALLDRMDWLRAEISQRTSNREDLEPSLEQFAQTRIDRLIDEYIDASEAAAALVLNNTGTPANLDADRARLGQAMADLSQMVVEELRRIKVTPPLSSPDKSAAAQAAGVADLNFLLKRVRFLFAATLKNNELGFQLGLDTSKADAAVKHRIENFAVATSTYLDLALRDTYVLRDQRSSLPADTELAGKLAAADRNVSIAAENLSWLATQMELLGMEASEYNAQVIATTGALTSDIFDLEVLGNLTLGFFGGIGDWFSDNGGPLVFKILIFLGILFIAWKIAGIAEALTRKGLNNKGVRLSQLLQRMIISTTRSVILALGFLMALSQLGITLGPLLAGLGIAGFIVGFALQDSLSNFASGMMILIYRPFDVGDVVDVSGAFGTVKHMSLVNTTILTIDNQTLVVPNNQIWQNVITNVTAQRTRRVDLVFGVSYTDDIEKVERVLAEVVSENERVLDDPEPMIRLHELGDSSVNFVVRPWVKTIDYWDVYWELTRAVKVRFDAEGISIPFPQRDVHLFAQEPMATAQPDTKPTPV